MTPAQIAAALRRVERDEPSPVREAAIAMLRTLHEVALQDERARNWWKTEEEDTCR